MLKLRSLELLAILSYGNKVGKKEISKLFFPGIHMEEAFFALGYLRHAEKFLCPNEDQHDVGVEKKLNTKKVFSSSNIIARIFF